MSDCHCIAYYRYYKYGIKSTWLKIHRVLNHRTLRDGTIQYLVKWRDLAYDQATWEDEDEDIIGMKTAVEFYHDLRAACNADSLGRSFFFFFFFFSVTEKIFIQILFILRCLGGS